MPLVSRLRALPAARRDLIFAVVLAVSAQIEIVVLIGGALDDRLSEHVIALGIPVLALRRSYPWAVAPAIYSMLVVGDLIGTDLEETISPFIAILAASWAVGAYAAGRRVWITGAVGTALVLFALVVDDYDDGVASVLIGPTLMVWVPLLLGRLVHERGRLNQALRASVDEMSRGRERALEEAVLEERTAIASELHDVVAHALSGMVIQAGAARRAAGTRDDQAREALSEIEETGREALTELRTLLGVLRRGDEEIALAPQPSLAHIGSLVRRAEAAGATVDLQIEGERPAVPAGVDLAAYRLVQEILRGAAESAPPGRASVRVRYRGEDLVVEVDDDVAGPPAPEHQAALVGIRERLAVYGGDLRVDSSGGGRSVWARLPLGAAS